MARFGADVAGGLGDAFSGAAEIKAGQLYGTVQGELLNQKIREQQERLRMEQEEEARRKLVADAQIAKATRDPYGIEEDEAHLALKKREALRAGYKPGSREYESYVHGIPAAVSKEDPLSEPEKKLKFWKENYKAAHGGQDPPQKLALQMANDILFPKEVAAPEKPPKPGTLEWLVTNVNPKTGKPYISAEEAAEHFMSRGIKTPEEAKVLPAAAQANMDKVTATMKIGHDLANDLREFMASDKWKKAGPSQQRGFVKLLSDAVTGAETDAESGKPKSFLEKLKDTAEAKKQAFLYFQGHIPSDYEKIITRAEQFTRRAAAELTGTRATRWLQQSMKHLPDVHGDSPQFMLDKLTVALENLDSVRDSIITAARTKKSDYLTSDQMRKLAGMVPGGINDNKIHKFQLSNGSTVGFHKDPSGQLIQDY